MLMSESRKISIERLFLNYKKESSFNWDFKTLAWYGLAAFFLFMIDVLVFKTIGFFSFGMFDNGQFLDAAWRFLRGQRLYVDFGFHTGPIQIYMYSLFFKIFGFGMTGILMHLAIINTCMSLMTFVIAKGRMPLAFACLCSFLTMVGFYWTYPHPYYDFTAHFFGLFGIAWLAQTTPFQNSRQAEIAGSVCGVMATLSFFTKTNIGGAYGIIYGLVFLVCSYPLRSLFFYCMGVLVTSTFTLLSLPSAPDFFKNLIESTQTVGESRFLRFIIVLVFFKNYFWVPFAVLLPITYAKRKRIIHDLILALGLGAIAIFTINTGSMRDWNYVPMLGIYMALSFKVIFDQLQFAESQARKICIGVGIIVLSFVCLDYSFRLSKSTFDSYTTIQNYSPSRKHVLQNGPFRGWVFSKEEGELLDQMIRAIQKIPANQTFLTLTQLPGLYAFAARDSFRGIPNHWFVANMPPKSKVPEVRRYIYSHVPDWILTYRDGKGEHPMNEIMGYLGIPPEFITSQYDMTNYWEAYALFKKRAL